MTKTIITSTNMSKENTSTVAVLNAHSSFNSSYGKDALDVALIFGSYEQEVSLFFQGEGVRQLISVQNASLINAKDYLATFSALEFYDVENIYVCLTSLKQRNLAADFHIDNVNVLPEQEFSARLRQHKTIIRF